MRNSTALGIDSSSFLVCACACWCACSFACPSVCAFACACVRVCVCARVCVRTRWQRCVPRSCGDYPIENGVARGIESVKSGETITVVCNAGYETVCFEYVSKCDCKHAFVCMC